MLAMGSILFGAGVLVVGLLALLFRNPRAPRWTQPEVVAMLTVIPVTGVLGLGFGYVLVGAYRLLHGAGDLSELAAFLAVAIVVAGVLRFVVAGRLRAYGPICAPAEVAAGPGAGLTVLACGLPRPQPPERPAPRPA